MGQKCLNKCKRKPEYEDVNDGQHDVADGLIVIASGRRTGNTPRGSRQVAPQNDYQEAAGAEVDKAVSKTEEDCRAIFQALNNHFIFTSLTEEDKEMVVNAMYLHTLEAGALVFEQDRPSKSYYVVRTGLLDVITNGKRVNRIKPGEGFGELALLHDNPRSATVRCLEKTELWGVDRMTFRRVIEDMNTQIYEQNREFLDKVALLSTLEPQRKDQLAASLVTMKFTSGQKIITEGETGQHLYIIKDGVVSCQKGTTEITRFHKGQYFGEQALLYNQIRSASCIAVEGTVKCVVLSRETLQKILGNQLQDIIHKNMAMQAMNASDTLKLLSKDQKDIIINEMEVKSYKAGDVVVHVKTPKYSKIFFILEGNLKVAKTGQLYADKGQCIGDSYVTGTQESGEYADDLIAGGDIKVGEITIYQFEVSIGGKYEDVVKENAATNILKNVYLFRTLPITAMKQLFNIIQVQKFNDGDIIIQESEVGEAIYIVKRGKVDIMHQGEVIRTVTKHDYFGERAILLENYASASCVARGSVTLWLIRKNDFIDLLDPPMRELLLSRIRIQDEKVRLNELIVVRLLGKGMFGKVYLVRTPGTSHLYALKAISRRKIDKFAIQEHLLLEKQIMLHVDHPAITRIVKTYKDSKRVYFLLEYVHGLELSVVLRHVGLLSNIDSQFYVASIMQVLQYLHERDILYRDMKPENVMVDSNGYIKLIDFGTSKLVQGRTYTLVGTPHYMAPEVIVGKGYGKMADLWSVGICLYEFLCGQVPYGEEEEDPYEIYEAILDMELEYVNVDLANFPAKQFIEQLLNKLPEMRFGGSYETLKKHEWFQGFDWEGLINQKITPPYTPDVGDLNEEAEGFEFDRDKETPWDELLSQMSEDTDDEEEIEDMELEEFKKTIPQNWDSGF